MAVLILYGASGHAKVIMEILQYNGIKNIQLWDDNVKPDILNRPVMQPIMKDGEMESYRMIISIGANSIRKKIAEKWQGKVYFGRAIHRNANISASADIGSGTVVMAGVSINADTRIGKHCIVNTNAVVDHDCIIHDFAHISPNATLCGNVTVGEGTHIGAGATIIPGITIGQWCSIGAGAVVIRNIPDGATVVGNPGKVIKTLEVLP